MQKKQAQQGFKYPVNIFENKDNLNQYRSLIEFFQVRKTPVVLLQCVKNLLLKTSKNYAPFPLILTSNFVGLLKKHLVLSLGQSIVSEMQIRQSIVNAVTEFHRNNPSQHFNQVQFHKGQVVGEDKLQSNRRNPQFLPRQVLQKLQCEKEKSNEKLDVAMELK